MVSQNPIVHAWNPLPDRCLNTNRLSTFKRNLRNINLCSCVQGQLEVSLLLAVHFFNSTVYMPVCQ
jgi:hypothetical protein